MEYLRQDDVLPEERVLSRMLESRDLIDANPDAAWNRAMQALNLLGRAELPNGVADVTVRRETRGESFSTSVAASLPKVPTIWDRPR